MRIPLIFFVLLNICNAIGYASDGLVFVYQTESHRGEKTRQSEMRIYYAEQGNRMEVTASDKPNSPTSIFFVTSDSKEVISLLPAEKQFVRMALNDVIAKLPKHEVSSFEKTGFKKNIDGKTCEIYRWTKDSQRQEACVYTDLDTYRKLDSIVSEWKKAGLDFRPEVTGDPVSELMKQSKGYPIEGTVNDSKGGILSLKLKKVSIQKIKSDLFQIPKGYSELKLNREADIAEMEKYQKKWKEQMEKQGKDPNAKGQKPSGLAVSPPRLVPVIENGVTTGFKILGIQPGSAIEKIGLKDGDIVHAINGEKTNTVEIMAALLEQTNSATQASILQISRNGKSLELKTELPCEPQANCQSKTPTK